MSKNVDDNDRDILIFNLIQKRLDGEWERLRSLDNKANSLIGFVSVAVSFLLGTGSLGFFDVKNLNQSVAAIFLVGIGVLIGSIIVALYGFKVRKWDGVPNVSYLIKEYKNKPHSIVLRRNAATMASVVEELEDKINEKAKYINYSWYATVIGLVLVFIFVIAAIEIGISVPENG